MHAVRPIVNKDVLAGHAVERGHVRGAVFGTLAALIALGAMPYPAHGDWTLGAGAGVQYDDNVGNAQSRSDIVADSLLDARLSIFQLYPLDDSYSVTVGSDLSGEAYRRLTGLDNASLDGTIALKKKWGLGAFVPWTRIGLWVGRSSYDDSYRNAWDYRATLAAGRRIDERWNFWADYSYERRAATPQTELVPGLSGDAFSQNSHNVAAHVEYSLNEDTFLKLGVLGRQGDVVSTSTHDLETFGEARALAADPAFGPGAEAYKFTGTTLGFELGVDYALTTHSVLGCAFKRLDTRVNAGNSYTQSIVEITWDYRR